ncbi:TolC family protein [bacterium]|nr:TolC family protein [bacterium]
MRIATGLLSLIILFASGCVTTTGLHTYTAPKEILEADVHHIDTIRLQALSHSTPISLQEASKHYLKEVLDKGKPKEQVSLSLADVRAAALQENLELQVQLYSPSLAQETANAERAKFDAVFGGGYQHAENDTPTASQLQGTQSTSDSFEFGLAKPLPTGGRINVSLPFVKHETNNPWSTLNPAYDADLSFSISQPLLRDAGIQANTHSIRVAEYQKTMAGAQTKLEAIRVLAAADRAYWLVYGASRELSIRQEQYALALRQLREAKLRVKAGAAPRVEIVRAESGVAARLEGIIQAATQLKLAERNLKRLMNSPLLTIDRPTGIVPTTKPNPVKLKLQQNELTQLALGNRMEMLELELQLVIDASTIDYRKNKKLPFFLMDYTYNVNGLGGSYGDAFDQLANVDHADWRIGVRGEMPIGNRAAKARLQHAILTRAQHLATKDLRQQTIKEEVLDALDLFNQNWQRILAARQETVFAGRTFQAERRQFELGIRTSTEVLEAAARLAEAQLREVRALVDYQISQVDIAYATGTLLGKAQVEWEAKG